MIRQTKKLIALSVLPLAIVVGCSSDDESSGNTNGMADTGMTDTGMTDTGMTDTGMTDTGMTDTGMTDTGMTDNGEMAFAFDTTAIDGYTRVDRIGMPAIATALISSKDSYNEASPTNDITGDFVGEIITSLQTLHGALDGQLTDLGLTPCTVVGDGSGSCVAFAQPLIIPDTLTLDTTQPSAFPNGRTLSDPVIDITLAVALLELTGDPAPHMADALVGVLNPDKNDKDFLDAFPFVAAPHQ